MTDAVNSTIEAVAERLRQAYSGEPVAPLRDALEPTDVDGAYAVQTTNTRHWVSEGRRIVGRKIGLTAKAVQAQLGVDQPDFGVLFADMEVADGVVLGASRLLQGKVEAEIALVLGTDLDNPEATAADVASAVEYVVPSLEIVDSRIADWKITFADTVADNASAAFYVLGQPARPLAGLDLWSCGMVMEINGQVVSTGVGAACLGHPLEAAAWLARTLAQRGDPLKAGDVMLTGALGPMVPLKAGDVVRATIGGLGTVGFTLEGDKA
jgi:2-keto-4-pentenoate hydratase